MMYIEEAEQECGVSGPLPPENGFYEKIYGNLPEAMLILDLFGDRVENANSAVCALLGYSGEQLLASSPRSLHSNDFDAFERFVRRARDGETRYSMPIECRHATGRLIPVLAEATRIDRADRPLLLVTLQRAAGGSGIGSGGASGRSCCAPKAGPISRPDEIIGNSAEIRTVIEAIDLIAPSDLSVLLTGETGTGKELVAAAIHRRSERSARPFVRINCAAIPAELLESELFGHERGAFSGAIARRAGRFELADGGTLFLDEIGELSLAAQAKLLRVLQGGVFERVGGGQSIETDVRIIAATNRDLVSMIGERLFREDLFYRLNIFPIQVPPLRARKKDIAPLAEAFLRRQNVKADQKLTLAPRDIEALESHDWPGNVRELQNLMQRAAILAREGVLNLSALLAQQRRIRTTGCAIVSSGEGSNALHRVVRDHILATLERHGWVIEGRQGAARALGLSPSTLRSRMRKLNVERP